MQFPETLQNQLARYSLVKTKTAGKILSVVFVLLLGAIAASAQTKTVNVRFAAGASEATYTNSVTGYGVVDFVLTAWANQQLTATLVSSTGNKAILTVMQNDERVADDASETTDWTGRLPNNGKYTVRVLMMRNDARRTKTPVKFTLRIRITN
jgi:hypothetical protein